MGVEPAGTLKTSPTRASSSLPWVLPQPGIPVPCMSCPKQISPHFVTSREYRHLGLSPFSLSAPAESRLSLGVKLQVLHAAAGVTDSLPLPRSPLPAPGAPLWTQTVLACSNLQLKTSKVLMAQDTLIGERGAERGGTVRKGLGLHFFDFAEFLDTQGWCHTRHDYFLRCLTQGGQTAG